MAQKQNGPEIHPSVEAGNPQSKRRKRKRATISMLLRLVTAIALSALAVVLRQCGHVSAEVAIGSIMILEAWAALWVGAWAQYMWGKWGGWC